jgi:hypothetical protein
VRNLGIDFRETGLAVEPTVDGWNVKVRGPRGVGSLGRGGVGLGLLLGLGGVASIAMVSADQLPMLVGVGLAMSGGLLFSVSTALGLFPSRLRLQAGAHHLDIEGVPGRSRVRIPWDQLGEIWIGDVRDTWEQTFASQFQAQPPGERTQELDRPVLGMRLRWTEDGRPAAFAHEATAWGRLELGRGLTRDQLVWLVDALQAAQAAAAESQAKSAFEESLAGRPTDKARSALDALRDRQG